LPSSLLCCLPIHTNLYIMNIKVGLSCSSSRILSHYK
jgi:hypothetical protein